jgi:thioredoxin 1
MREATSTDDPELEEIRRRKLALLQGSVSRPVLSEPVHVDQGRFESLIAEHDLVLVDFWADWCRPCHMIAPSLAQIAKERSGRLVVAKVDIDSNRALQQAFGVHGIPTVVLVKGGREVARVTGAVPKGRLDDMLRPYLRDGGD